MLTIISGCFMILVTLSISNCQGKRETATYKNPASEALDQKKDKANSQEPNSADDVNSQNQTKSTQSGKSSKDQDEKSLSQNKVAKTIKNTISCNSLNSQSPKSCPLSVEALPAQPLQSKLPKPVGFNSYKIEGFGSETPGGLKGKILVVNRLDDSLEAGTLRWAVQSKGARTIIFKTSGTIVLNQELKISEPNMSVYGHTAPNEGITIVGAPVSIETHDIVLRYLRFRLGTTTGAVANCNPKKTDCTFDTMVLKNAERIVIDHCSFSFSIDEVLSIVDSKDITIQYSIISDPLRTPKTKSGVPLHNEGDHDHGFCSLFRGSSRISLHHSLYGFCEQRSPQISAKGKYDPSVHISNNFIYGYGSKATKFNASSSSKGEAQISIAVINNAYEATNNNDSYPIQLELSSDLNLKVIVEGNSGPYMSKDPWSMVDPSIESELDAVRMTTITNNPNISTDSVNLVKNLVTSRSGANFPVRDHTDASLMKLIAKGQHREIDSETEIEGYDSTDKIDPKNLTALQDSDQDGIPDNWEIKFKLNPKLVDSLEQTVIHGTSNLDAYLMSLMP